MKKTFVVGGIVGAIFSVGFYAGWETGRSVAIKKCKEYVPIMASTIGDLVYKIGTHSLTQEEVRQEAADALAFFEIVLR